MNKYMQYQRGALSWIKPSSAFVEGTQWICLDGTVQGNVPRLALHYLRPDERAGVWDTERGVPEGIDWARQPDWYDRQYHWRGFIPAGALGSKGIPKPDYATTHQDLEGKLGSDLLGSHAVEKAREFNNLLSLLKSFLVDLTERSIPLPQAIDLGIADATFTDEISWVFALCEFSYGMLDLLGFFRWAAAVFEREIGSKNCDKFVLDMIISLEDEFKGDNIGYLVHLEAHYREFGFRLYVEEGVPFYYPWLDAYDDEPRFRRFHPAWLGFVEDPETWDVIKRKLNFWPHDHYLQEVGKLCNRNDYDDPLKPEREHWVVDFEGWTRRALRAGEAEEAMTRLFFWEDYQVGSKCLRFHFTWRPRFDPGLDSDVEDDDDDDEPHHGKRDALPPLNADFIRERYKFTCAPSEGDDLEPFQYCRKKQPKQTTQLRLEKFIAEPSVKSPEITQEPEHTPILQPLPASQEDLDIETELPVVLGTLCEEADTDMAKPAAVEVPAPSEIVEVDMSLEAEDVDSMRVDEANAPETDSAVPSIPVELKALFDGPATSARDLRVDSPPRFEDSVSLGEGNSGNEMEDAGRGKLARVDDPSSTEAKVPAGASTVPSIPVEPNALIDGPVTSARDLRVDSPPREEDSVSLGEGNSDDEMEDVGRAQLARVDDPPSTLLERIEIKQTVPLEERLSSTLIIAEGAERANNPSSLYNCISSSFSLQACLEPSPPTPATGHETSRKGRNKGSLLSRVSDSPRKELSTPGPSSLQARIQETGPSHDQERRPNTSMVPANKIPTRPDWSRRKDSKAARVRPIPLPSRKGKERSEPSRAAEPERTVPQDEMSRDASGWIIGEEAAWGRSYSIRGGTGTYGGGWDRVSRNEKYFAGPSSAHSSSSSKRRSSRSPEDSPSSIRKRTSSLPRALSVAAIAQRYVDIPVKYTTASSPIDDAHPYLSLSSPKVVRRSEKYARWMVLSFGNKRSEVKLRLWALLQPLSEEQLIHKALCRYLPLQLPIRTDCASLFKKEHLTAMEMRSVYYRSDYSTKPLLWDPNPQALWSAYVASVLDLLGRPYARALIFRGGLVARLVRAFAPPSFYTDLLAGPSVQVTRYNKGITDPEANTVNDEVTMSDCNVILGVTTTPPGNGIEGVQAIWPPNNIFEQCFRGWTGEWDSACESWFVESWNIRENNATTKKAREWSAFLKKHDFAGVPSSSAMSRIPDAAWDAAWAHLKDVMGDNWDNVSLSRIPLPVAVRP